VTAPEVSNTPPVERTPTPTESGGPGGAGYFVAMLGVPIAFLLGALSGDHFGQVFGVLIVGSWIGAAVAEGLFRLVERLAPDATGRLANAAVFAIIALGIAVQIGVLVFVWSTWLG